MNPAGTAKIWTLGNRHSRKRPLGRKSLARYGAMESARRERLASGEAHGECKAEPASAGSIYDEATNRRSGTFLLEAIRIPVQIVALHRIAVRRLGIWEKKSHAVRLIEALKCPYSEVG